MTEDEITGYRKDRGLRWINWRSIRFLVTVGIVSTIISHFSEGETRPVSQTLTEHELWNELQNPAGPVQNLVTKLEQSVCLGDGGPFTRAIDHDAILSRATGGVAPGEGSDRIRSMFLRGTRAAWAQTPLVHEYLNKHFRFLRPRTIRGHAGLLFRASDEGGGLNYYLLMVAKGANGEIRIQDIFVVGINEAISTTLGRTYRHLVAEFTPGDTYDSVVEDREVSSAFVASLPNIAKMNRDFQAKDYAAVLESFDGLPDAAKRDHKVMLMRVEASEFLGKELHDTAMTDWKAVYPSEKNLPLKFIDYYAGQGNYVAAEKVIRELNEDLGGDSYLKFRLGEILLAKEVSPEGIYPAPRGKKTGSRGTTSSRRGRGRAVGK